MSTAAWHAVCAMGAQPLHARISSLQFKRASGADALGAVLLFFVAGYQHESDFLRRQTSEYSWNEVQL